MRHHLDTVHKIHHGNIPARLIEAKQAAIDCNPSKGSPLAILASGEWNVITREDMRQAAHALDDIARQIPDAADLYHASVYLLYWVTQHCDSDNGCERNVYSSL